MLRFIACLFSAIAGVFLTLVWQQTWAGHGNDTLTVWYGVAVVMILFRQETHRFSRGLLTCLLIAAASEWDDIV
jgi:hypothetical protein